MGFRKKKFIKSIINKKVSDTVVKTDESDIVEGDN
jgi:hypothetical protein